MPFFLRHIIINQLLTSIAQAGNCGVGTNATGFKILNPFLQRSDGYFIELIHTNQEIFRKNFCRKFMDESILFFSGYFEPISSVYSREVILTMVQIIITLTYIEVKDADGINLFHLVVASAKGDALCDRFRNPIDDTFQIMQLTNILNLYNNDFTFTVFSLNVYPAKLIIYSPPIIFAFQQFDDFHVFAQQNGPKTLKYTKICFSTKKVL